MSCLDCRKLAEYQRGIIRAMNHAVSDSRYENTTVNRIITLNRDVLEQCKSPCRESLIFTGDAHGSMRLYKWLYSDNIYLDSFGGINYRGSDGLWSAIGACVLSESHGLVTQIPDRLYVMYGVYDTGLPQTQPTIDVVSRCFTDIYVYNELDPISNELVIREYLNNLANDDTLTIYRPYDAGYEIATSSMDELIPVK